MYTLLFMACQLSVGSEPTPPPTPPPKPALSAPAAQAEPAQQPETTMPPLSPSGPFLSWLSTQESTLILPFRIGVSPLGIESSVLLADPKVPMSLDTGAMGIALDTRLQDHCPGEAECSVWLKGRYGPLLGSALAPAGHSFTVYEVIEPVIGQPTQARRE